MTLIKNQKPTIALSGDISRRTAVAATLAAPVLVSGLGFSNAIAASHASAPEMTGPMQAKARRVKVGDFEVTTLLAGSVPRGEIQSIFGMNVSREEFAAAADANYISPDAAQFYFTPTVVNTGSDLVLFDTGLNAGAMAGALGEAGYKPEQISVVVITHNHGDHVGGLVREDGSPAYPNARYVTGRVEFDTDAKVGKNKRFNQLVKPLGDQMTFLEGGQDVVTGITSVEAFGHTPGHMTYAISSGDKSLLIAADFANHYVFSLAYPDWEVKFDRDKAGAAATRRKLLDMLAADKMAFIGYHMPFPAMGFVAKDGANYRYVPVSYQFAG